MTVISNEFIRPSNSTGDRGRLQCLFIGKGKEIIRYEEVLLPTFLLRQTITEGNHWLSQLCSFDKAQ